MEYDYRTIFWDFHYRRKSLSLYCTLAVMYVHHQSRDYSRDIPANASLCLVKKKTKKEKKKLIGKPLIQLINKFIIGRLKIDKNKYLIGIFGRNKIFFSFSGKYLLIHFKNVMK